MKTFTTNLDAESAVSQLLKGVESENMRVVAHINGQANAAMIGKEVPADQILEIFRPDYAVRVWTACKAAGHDIPLRIHVYEEDALVKVSCRMPSDVFAPFRKSELDVIGEELDGVFNNILDQVTEA